ncbi:hypothetical protein B4U80_14292, partial [Leptotrombidium deliense]
MVVHNETTKYTGMARNVAFWVGVVDSNERTLYDQRIYWSRNEIMSTVGHINGFWDKRLLEQGKDLADVKENFLSKRGNTLFVTFNGIADFTSLDLNTRFFDWIDIQQHFFQEVDFKFQTISLKRLVKHYFKKDIQSGVHSPVQDAKWTMRNSNTFQ